MQPWNPTHNSHIAAVRIGPASPLGLTAIVAVLHLAVFSGRVRGRRFPAEPGMYLIWRVPICGQNEAGGTAVKVPSNPIHTYCVGHLALTMGMAVIVLAAWLLIMRINGALGL